MALSHLPNFMLHTKALTAAEVSQNYNAHRSRYGL
jgi:hypothetical protein